MRGSGPAVGAAGVLTVSWVVWELWQVLWLQDLTVGITGVAVLPWMGLALMDDPTWMATVTFVALPLGLGALSLAVTVGLLIGARESRIGAVLFGLGAVAALGWALLAGLVGLGVMLDTRLQLPVFAVGLFGVYDWSPWGRWLFDAAALVLIAALLGFGPKTPLARRALWTGLLAVLADSGWRVGVTLFSGQIPILYRGLGAGDWVFAAPLGQTTSLGVLFSWVVFGALALGFVALFANLPNRDGPHPALVLVGLALAGLWLGLQAAALYSVGLLEAMGSQPVLFSPLPEYHGMLACLRLALLAVGAGSLGLAAWRLGE